MPDTDGTCEYVLDPNDPETWGGGEGDECYVDEKLLNEDGVWTCPHKTEGNGSRCIFHLSLKDKKDEAVVTRLLDKLGDSVGSDDSKPQEVQFIGAKFGRFDLGEDIIKSKYSDKCLIMTHSDFNGEINWSELKMNISTVLKGANFYGEFNAKGTEFRRDLNFSGATFNESAAFSGGEFGGKVDFYKSEFCEDVDFTSSKFTGTEIIFTDAVFGQGVSFGAWYPMMGSEFNNKGDILFKNTKFNGENIVRFEYSIFNNEGVVDFQTSEFNNEGGVTFSDVKFRSDVYFGDTSLPGSGTEFNCGDEIAFQNTHFYSNIVFSFTEFGNDVWFEGAQFTGDGIIEFERSEFKSNAIFTDTKWENSINKVNFNGVKFQQEVNFADIEFNNNEVSFVKADITDADFSSSVMENVDFEKALMSRTTLFNTDVRGSKLSGAVLGDARINEDTKFLGHPSGEDDSSPHTISAIRSRPTCIYDPNYEENNEHKNEDKAKSVYRALEELGGKHARPRLQARSFVRRQDLQKQDYWDDATADDASLEERFIAGARWSRAKVARATLLYGESPWRVIAWSLGIIFSFALLYPLGGWIESSGGSPITYGNILESVYFSTLTYTALGFGDFQPVGLGRLLTTLETSLGAVMLALLVFILGRRAAR